MNLVPNPELLDPEDPAVPDPSEDPDALIIEKCHFRPDLCIVDEEEEVSIQAHNLNL